MHGLATDAAPTARPEVRGPYFLKKGKPLWCFLASTGVPEGADGAPPPRAAASAIGAAAQAASTEPVRRRLTCAQAMAS